MQLKNKLMTVGCVAAAAAALVAGTACNDHELSPFSKSLSSGKIQSTSSGSARPVDILFVVDNSISMADEQMGLDSNFGIFLDRLIEANADFRLATVSTSYTGVNMPFETKALDSGASVLKSNDANADIEAIKKECAAYYDQAKIYDFSSNEWVNRGKDDASYESKEWIDFTDFKKPTGGKDSDFIEKRSQLIKNLFRCQAIMGTNGDATEKGLATMRSSLAAHRVVEYGDKDQKDFTSSVLNFKRPNSILTVVFVTDENDCSSSSTLLSGSQCEVYRNIEDACAVAREDSIQTVNDVSSLQLSSGLAVVDKESGIQKTLRDWCVQGDETARRVLKDCLEDSECTAASYIKCPEAADGSGKKCEDNKLEHRSEFYNFLLDYVISSNGASYRAQNAEMFNNAASGAETRAIFEELAKSDIIIASIINRDQGIRYDVNLPENWCGVAGSQSYRYQLFAEMFGNSPIYAPICCKNEEFGVNMITIDKENKKVVEAKKVCTLDKTGENGEFGPVLSVIGQRIGEAVNTICADAAPVTCKIEDCNEKVGDGYGDEGRADKAATCPCLYGCNKKAYMANSANEYHLCNGFSFKVGAQPTATSGGVAHDYTEGVEYNVDYESNYCRTRTGSPIQVNMITTEPGFNITFEYPKAVTGR